jgi:hypothetical protein
VARPTLLLAAGLLAGLPRIASALPDLTAEVYGATHALPPPPGLANALSARGNRLRRLAVRLVAARSPISAKLEARLATRLRALARMLARATCRGRCDTTPAAAEAERLRRQLQTLQQAS